MFFLCFLYVAQNMEMKVVSVGKHGQNLTIQNRKRWYPPQFRIYAEVETTSEEDKFSPFVAQYKSLLNYMLYVYINDLKY